MRVGLNSPSLWPTIDSVTYTGTCLRPSWTAIVWPTMSGMIVERRDQVLMTRRSPAAFWASTFFSRWSSTNGPFFRLRDMDYLRPLPVRRRRTMSCLRRLVLVAGAALGLAPRGHGGATTGRAALATTERVVDGVHGDTTGLRADALPAVAAGLADLDQLVLAVADLADGGPAVDQHAAHLGGRHAQRGEVAVLGDELHGDAGRAADLAALAGAQLDVVHGRCRPGCSAAAGRCPA